MTPFKQQYELKPAWDIKPIKKKKHNTQAGIFQIILFPNTAIDTIDYQFLRSLQKNQFPQKNHLIEISSRHTSYLWLRA